MEIKQTAMAGTLESSDIQITLTPIAGATEIHLDSSVGKQFGEQIKQVITETLASYKVEHVRVDAVDRGALDCTIQARTQTVIQRGLDQVDQVNWEVL
ncbi:citrate lyase acyl carrier protein [Isobaculum melis]|nr:citrate lyase acyl carrier protein [Isobaculum melis]